MIGGRDSKIVFYEKSHLVKHECGFTVPSGILILGNGKENHHEETSYVVSYTCQHRPANGIAAENLETLCVGYDDKGLYPRPLYKNNGHTAAALVIQNGKIISPEDKQAISIADLDEKVVEGLVQIEDADTQQALGKYIKGYHPTGVLDARIKNALGTITGVSAIARAVQHDVLIYIAFIQEGHGLQVAPKISQLREAFERDFPHVQCSVKEMYDSAYHKTTKHLQKNANGTFFELYRK